MIELDRESVDALNFAIEILQDFSSQAPEEARGEYEKCEQQLRNILTKHRRTRMNGLSEQVAQLELDCEQAEALAVELIHENSQLKQDKEDLIHEVDRLDKFLDDEQCQNDTYRDELVELDMLRDERDTIINENINFSWHLECLGYDDMTIDKIANGFHREDKI